MRWARVAGVVALQALACGSWRGDDVSACKATQAQLARDRSKAHAAIAICDRAYRRTRAPDALAGRTYAHLLAGELDAVIAAAREVDAPAFARVWHLAGDAELERGHHAEARAWYERALAANRDVDPKRAGNSASRIAEIAEAENALEEAIHYRYLGVTLAEATGEPEPRLLTTLGLVELLLSVGDARTARRALASVAGAVDDASPFRQDYLRAAGEADAIAGRPSAAAASFARCTETPAETANPYAQLGCRVGLAALHAHGLRASSTAEALALLDEAATFLDPADRLFGVDPDRRAEVAWLRALVHLRAGDAGRALATLDGIERAALGAAMRSRIAHARGAALVAVGDGAAAEAAFRAAAAEIEKLRDQAAHRATRRSLPRELRAPYEAIFVLRARAGDARGALAVMERALERDFVDQLAAGVVGAEDAAAALSRSVEDAERRVRALRLLDARPAATFDVAAAPGARPTAVGFFAAEGSLWRVVVTRDAVRASSIAPLAELGPIVAAAAADPGAPEANGLGARLLPADVLPPAGEPLVLVPDPSLEGMRFAALRGPEGGYLIERHPLVLAPTFGRGLASTPGGESPAGPPVVLGDPDATLPSARTEATVVADLLGVEPRLGPAANRTALHAARRASVLHVASHGSVRDDGSTISLADLTLGPTEVLELGLGPDLAVIASCASAATRPDGMWTSITSALLAGGTRTIVGALGSIPDGASAEIVTDFHRRRSELGPARALAGAQRAAIARGVPVGVWSSFAVFGHDPRTTRRN